MKILVLGHGDHGKDTFAAMMHKTYGVNFSSSSWFALDRVIWPQMKDMYHSKEECFEARHKMRTIWKEMIAQYNFPDRTRLCKEILKEHDMYVGLRHILEYEAVYDLFNVIFYVDAHMRKPLDESMGISFDPTCMVKIDNNQTIEDLQKQVDKLSYLFNATAA